MITNKKEIIQILKDYIKGYYDYTDEDLTNCRIRNQFYTIIFNLQEEIRNIKEYFVDNYNFSEDYVCSRIDFSKNDIETIWSWYDFDTLVKNEIIKYNKLYVNKLNLMIEDGK